MELTKHQSAIIEANRISQHVTKRTCKEFVKILKDFRGEINNQCFCSQSERDTYCRYFYSELEKINQTNDPESTEPTV